ncbi:MAG: bifunctional riboflavin kinase/FAD synthetase [Desulfobacteraceae bacterium]|nr:bifunctional riboflavin kinase/FAD synthetase [Desulfobacteraceae bacterium]
MHIIENIDDIKQPLTKAVLTIGNFDGVHIGHQALFHEVIEKADDIGGVSVAMTFDPHPLRALQQNGHLPLITLKEQKIELIGNSGIDVLIVQPFSRQFASISARRFVEDLLIGRIGMRAMVVGRDYRFGANREGDLPLLQRYAEEMGFEVIVTDWIQSKRDDHERISSTRIRELVNAGEVGRARNLLGRHYQIRGSVVKGRDRGGRLLGFPTANIQLTDELCPRMGVYAVTIQAGGQLYRGVANIGYSPTFDDHLFTVEVHIFDFSGDLYGEEVRVNFVERIRDELRFSSIEALSREIRNDVRRAQDILSSYPDPVARNDHG